MLEYSTIKHLTKRFVYFFQNTVEYKLYIKYKTQVHFRMLRVVHENATCTNTVAVQNGFITYI